MSDDFTKHRKKSKKRVKSGGSRKKPGVYRPAPTFQPGKPGKSNSPKLQVGLTIWKLQLAGFSRSRHSQSARLGFIAKRVEADTPFRRGELLRLSIESPRAGYLYVVNRDWFADGRAGETRLIFPIRGEDNRLEAGKLIDIPAPEQTPFRADPAANQQGELLTIIITSAPLRLRLSNSSLPISSAQLAEWEARWSGFTERFELEGGAGQARSLQEEQAASRKGSRQLTRNDPGPQTIYLLTPTSRDGLLFNVMLSYVW